MFLENKPFLIQNNDLEKKYFFFLEKKDLNNKYIYNDNTSFNAFIITIDNKYLYCERQNSFYWTYLIKNFKEYNTYIYKKLPQIVKNLLIEEFLAFYIYLNKKNIHHIKLLKEENFFNIKNIKKNIEILKKSEINLKHITTFYLNDLTEIFNNFLKNKNIIKRHHSLILPGGKKISNEDLFSVISREVKEEINLNLLNSNLKILTKNYVFENYNKNPEPIFLYIKIFDKILKKYYNNICVLLKVDNFYYNINFNSNKEIKKIFYIKSNINKNFTKKNFICDLNKSNSFFNNG